jgi:hypothetical protein
MRPDGNPRLRSAVKVADHVYGVVFKQRGELVWPAGPPQSQESDENENMEGLPREGAQLLGLKCVKIRRRGTSMAHPVDVPRLPPPGRSAPAVWRLPSRMMLEAGIILLIAIGCFVGTLKLLPPAFLLFYNFDMYKGFAVHAACQDKFFSAEIQIDPHELSRNPFISPENDGGFAWIFLQSQRQAETPTLGCRHFFIDTDTYTVRSTALAYPISSVISPGSAPPFNYDRANRASHHQPLN